MCDALVSHFCNEHNPVCASGNMVFPCFVFFIIMVAQMTEAVVPGLEAAAPLSARRIASGIIYVCQIMLQMNSTQSSYFTLFTNNAV